MQLFRSNVYLKTAFLAGRIRQMENEHRKDETCGGCTGMAARSLSPQNDFAFFLEQK
ncbi:MAG: hypothetical protein LBT05_08180 [Planctomycetaceae bacterium]|nr:hypothetical protein [Planctomycetaceae bacterium]